MRIKWDVALKQGLAVLGICIILTGEYAWTQNLGAAPQTAVAVKGETGAQPEGAFLNFINWVGNVIAPVQRCCERNPRFCSLNRMKLAINRPAPTAATSSNTNVARKNPAAFAKGIHSATADGESGRASVMKTMPRLWRLRLGA